MEDGHGSLGMWTAVTLLRTPFFWCIWSTVERKTSAGRSYLKGNSPIGSTHTRSIDPRPNGLGEWVHLALVGEPESVDSSFMDDMEEKSMSREVETHPMISIRATATVKDAARLMADCSIGAVGVLASDGDFMGIVTERDLTWFVAKGHDSAATRVTEITNDFPVILDAPLDQRTAIERMHAGRIRHLIVHDDDGYRLVSMRDLVRIPQMDGFELTAGDVMSAPAVACREHAFIEEAAEILADRDISGMPVVNSVNEVVGVISERDLAHSLGGPLVRLAVRRPNHPRFTTSVGQVPRADWRVKEIMTSPAITTQADPTLAEIARLMQLARVNRLPVMDGAGLVGVVTRGDILATLAHLNHDEIHRDLPPVLLGSEGLGPGSSLYHSGLDLEKAARHKSTGAHT